MRGDHATSGCLNSTTLAPSRCPSSPVRCEKRISFAEQIANLPHGTNRFTKVENTEVLSITKEEAARQLGTTPKAITQARELI
jgi:hypothetical protein